MPAPSAIDPFHDPRVSHRAAKINGWKYKYLYAEPPSGKYDATVVLIHGWPDLSMGWRYQIPLFLELGLRVIAPDLMGFGGSDVPKAPPESLSLYSQRRACSDIRDLCHSLGVSSIVLGGHDWGGAVAWRFALWFPDFISHIFCVCTPYDQPSKTFKSLETVVSRAPQFGYQLHLAGPEVESRIETDRDIRQFLNGMYGARTPDGKVLFSPEKGLDFSVLPLLGKTKLMSDREMDYYVQEYSQSGMHGTLNWYRTREVNWKEELELKSTVVSMPALFIQADKDNVLLPSMSVGMEKSIPNLTRRSVPAGHWALWQTATACNEHLREWLNEVLLKSKVKL